MMNEFIIKTTYKTRLNKKTLKGTRTTSVYAYRVTRKDTIQLASKTITVYWGYRVRKDNVEMGTWNEKVICWDRDLRKDLSYEKYELVTRELAYN
tara:strand:- start:37 stop:321 length:285 start_codon:yes stop_codon:yes gene_type:complete